MLLVFEYLKRYIQVTYCHLAFCKVARTDFDKLYTCALLRTQSKALYLDMTYTALWAWYALLSIAELIRQC